VLQNSNLSEFGVRWQAQRDTALDFAVFDLGGRQIQNAVAASLAGVLQKRALENSEAANACARRLPVNCWDWPEADCRAFLKRRSTTQ